MNFFTILFSFSFLILTLAIAAVVFVINRVILYKTNDINKAFWRDTFLPIVPIFVSIVFALTCQDYDFPDGVNSLSSKIAFSMVAGLLSAQSYRLIKIALKNKK